MDTPHPYIRLRLAEVLSGLAVSPAELARRMCATRQWVDQILARESERTSGGPRRGVSLATVEELAAALRVDPSVLLETTAAGSRRPRPRHRKPTGE